MFVIIILFISVLIETIGTGACGSVYLCLNTHTSEFVAMKEVVKTKSKVLGFPGGPAAPKPRENREIEIWKQLNHPNIVKLVEVILDEGIYNFYKFLSLFLFFIFLFFFK